MKLNLVAAVALLMIPAAAPAMPVQTFLAKANALKSKGPLALLSGDYKLLMNTIKADAGALRNEREAAKAAGRKPPYCPPGPITMGSSEIMRVMQAVPAAERPRTDTRDALRGHFARRFPCRN
jgi:hypothetical protein